MNPALHSPFAAFRFALRERDWRLAAALARALADSERGRRRLEAELTRSAPSNRCADTPSLLALRVIARLLRAVGPGDGRG
ncbi:MAG: hypothetical protein ACRDK9_08755 [Solirubrobacterales bacterium]